MSFTGDLIMLTKIRTFLICMVLLISLFVLVRNAPSGTTENISGNIMVSDDPTGNTLQTLPDIIIDNSGTIHVLWYDFRDGSRDLYYSNSTNKGVSFNTGKKIGDADAGSLMIQKGPSIAIDNNGKIHVAWFHYTGSIFNIYTANSTDGGKTFKTNPKIADQLSADQFGPDISIYGINNVYAVWMDTRTTGTANVYFAKSSDSGSSFGSDIKINTDSGNALHVNPSIAVDSKGIIHVVWEDNRSGDIDIYYANSTNTGASFNSDKSIAGGTGSDQTKPSITIDRNDKIYVTYSDDRNDDSDIYFVKSSNSGDSWTTGIKVNDNIATTTQTHSTVGVNSTGKIYVAFQDNRTHTSDSFDDIYLANSTDGGISFGSDDIVNNDTGSNNHIAPKIAIAPDDSVYIVWTDNRKNFFDIYLAKIKGKAIANHAPNIISMEADPPIAIVGGSTNITVIANDLDEDPLSYSYDVTGGTIQGTGSQVKWLAPGTPGVYNITAWVSDGKINSDTMTINVTVRLTNYAPVVNNVTADKLTIGPGNATNITVNATDIDDDILTYFYNATAGYFSGTGKKVLWHAPDLDGIYEITAWVNDGLLDSNALSINITVKGGITANIPPVVISITADPVIVAPEGSSNITVVAHDLDSENLTYHYSTTGGSIIGTGPNVTWKAPQVEDIYMISVKVNDGYEDSNSKDVNITVSKIVLNRAPIIKSITAKPEVVNTGDVSNISVIAEDPDEDLLEYIYNCSGGTIYGTGSKVTWKAPDSNGIFIISVKVFDGLLFSNPMDLNITVTGGENTAPVVLEISANKTEVQTNSKVLITVQAKDDDEDVLTYIYSTNGGTIEGKGANVTWQAPGVEGTYTISVRVNDGIIDSNTKSVVIKVKESGKPEPSDYPDLIIMTEDISFSKIAPVEGDTITISVIVRNNGSVKAIDVAVNFYYNDNLIGNKTLTEIQAKGQQTITISWLCVPGTFTIKAVVDEEKAINESNELNNYGSREITVKKKSDDGKDDEQKEQKEAEANVFLYVIPVIIVIIIIIMLLFFRSKKKGEKPEEKKEIEEAEKPSEQEAIEDEEPGDEVDTGIQPETAKKEGEAESVPQLEGGEAAEQAVGKQESAGINEKAQVEDTKKTEGTAQNQEDNIIKQNEHQEK
jgi:hypothetical protein